MSTELAVLLIALATSIGAIIMSSLGLTILWFYREHL